MGGHILFYRGELIGDSPGKIKIFTKQFIWEVLRQKFTGLFNSY